MSRQSRKERDDQLMKMATNQFRHHVIEKREEGVWYIRKPGESYFWCHIAVLGRRAVVVWGDIESVIFVQGSRFRSNIAAINWIAGSNLDYAGEKAIREMGGEVVEVLETDVAIDDLLEMIKDSRQDWERLEEQVRYVQLLSEAITALRDGCDIRYVQQELYNEMTSIDQDCGEWVYTIGRCIGPRVVYALAAVTRLAALIREEKDDDEDERGGLCPSSVE